jgi:hypothetical protein
VAQLDEHIDALYQLRPDEFTSARTALAMSLTGEQARQVSRLKKPPTVPWAVNQVYWKARPIYGRVIQQGEALRSAQIATLKGRKADVRGIAARHREAIADAVHRALDLATDHSLKPKAEELARMFEALSLAPAPPTEPAGRFTKVLELAGFDALAGVTLATRPTDDALPRPTFGERAKAEPPSVDRAAARRHARDQRVRRRQAEATLKMATEKLERARRVEAAARRTLSRAQADVGAAEHTLSEAQARLRELGQRDSKSG